MADLKARTEMPQYSSVLIRYLPRSVLTHVTRKGAKDPKMKERLSEILQTLKDYLKKNLEKSYGHQYGVVKKEAVTPEQQQEQE